MAENLTFPIKFDLEGAVDAAGKEWEGKYAGMLEKAIAKRAVRVRLDFEKLEDVKKRLAELKVEPITPETKSAIRELARELQVLAKALEQVQKYANNPARGAVDASKVQLNEARAKAQAALAAQRAAKAEDNLASARLRDAKAANVGTTATRGASKAYGEQMGYLQRLTQRMAAYWAVQRVGSFLTNVREVTAEFELQRVSLGAIIQDQQRANELFSEIKAFALTSPLKILDLTKYTKQVAAYGFETEKLFDTTKMLADISVGLGTDMGRLTLFLGQVFATGYLRASELRQATEAGIPLVEKLGKKLEEMNGRVYTAAEVMDLISKRAIGYDIVEQVFKDMTSAGGEFYNMQVKQSQTLFGMWSKLGDAAALMYDEIGNTAEVNAAMKATIGLLEGLMRNWEMVANGLTDVGVAVGLYVLGMKAVAIATSGVTAAEAARLAVTKAHLIATPKLVAAMVGENTAKMLSMKLTRLHTVALMRQSLATSIATKSFWKLTAALMSNPWTALATAVAGAVMALWNFVTGSDTAADSADRLNESVASLKNSGEMVRPLVEAYTELSGKTERTAQEQKKLTGVVRDLAKQFPSAVLNVNRFTGEIDLAIGKVRELYGVMKDAKEQTVRVNVRETEKKIEELTELVGKYNNMLKWGGGMFRDKEMGEWVFGKGLTERNREEIMKRIAGYTGQIEDMQKDVVAAKRALGELKDENTEAVDEFGAWKKELQDFKYDMGEGIEVNLWDNSTINQFNNLDAAMADAAKMYKEATELVGRYDKAVAESAASEESRAKAAAERAEQVGKQEQALAALTRFGYKPDDFDKNNKGMFKGVKGNDSILSLLKEMEEALTTINKKYEELARREGKVKAAKHIEELYGDMIDYFNRQGQHFGGLEMKMPVTTELLQADRKEIMKKVEQLKDEANDTMRRAALKYMIELGVRMDTTAADELRRRIDEKIKELADKVSRTKTAKEFYDKVLGMTGNYNLAATVAEGIFGGTGSTLAKDIREQMMGAFAWLKGDNEDAWREAMGLIEGGEYEKLLDYVRLLPQEQRKAAEELVKAQQEASAAQVVRWVKDLERAQDYADKRIELARETSKAIAEIEERERRLDPEAEGYDDRLRVLRELRRGYEQREVREGAKLEWEALKDTPLYVQMFEDLEHASTATLERMRGKLVEMQGAMSGALAPTELKEMQRRLDEIDGRLRERNPWKTLKGAWQQYRDAVGGVTVEGAAERVGVATTAHYNASAQYGYDSKEARAAAESLKVEEARLDIARKLTDEQGRRLRGQKALDRAVEVAGDAEAQAKLELQTALAKQAAETTEEGKVAADAEVQAKAEALRLAQRVTEALQRDAKAGKTLRDTLAKGLNVVGEGLNGAAELAKGIGKMTEALGGDEEDVQFWSDIAGGLEEVTAGLTGLVQSVMSMDIGGIISNAIGAIPNMVSGFVNIFSAGRVRKANKEIRRQQRILDELEYTYGRLEKAAEGLFGTDYISNYNQQMRVLEAEAAAYLKQAEAERSKGKKRDKDRLKEFEDAWRETRDKIKDMEGELASKMMGTSREGAAREFVDAWLDAKVAFGNTTAAIEGKYKDMVRSMVMEGAAARVVDALLAPMWKGMDELLGRNDIDGAVDYLVEGMDRFVASADGGLNVLYERLKARGYDMQKILGDSEGDLTGISRDIATASEESINGLAAGINTQNYYISHIDASVSEILGSVKALGALGTVGSLEGGGWTDWQAQAMENYNAIARNTGDTVARCERAAAACERMANYMGRAMRSKGAQSGFNVWVN